MLTRLQVTGFKNLRRVDIQFGWFTCIAGPNGVGKSNVFDVITFLGDLASMPLVEAATRVRGTNERIAGIANLFSSRAADQPPRMELVAEMIVPVEVHDDFDREARATATFLRYTLELRLGSVADEDHGERDPIYIEREELVAKNSSEAATELHFKPPGPWLRQHVKGPGNRRTAFIDTDSPDNGVRAIRLYGDQTGRGGPPYRVPARKSPRTVLSGINANSHPTALAARREMQSWRLLQLEPSALRSLDEFGSASTVDATGRHLPNALLRIGSQAEVAGQLAEFIPGIVSVDVDSDVARQQRMLSVTLKDRHPYSASALSDGTLRFLALAILASDIDMRGLMCLEEPENGIHPLRIPQMLELVRSLADMEDFDPEVPNPAIRQVIINTHSPLVVAALEDSDLLMAESVRQGGLDSVNFKPLRKTWRGDRLDPEQCITRGELERYLGVSSTPLQGPQRKRHVRDHLTPDLFESNERR